MVVTLSEDLDSSPISRDCSISVTVSPSVVRPNSPVTVTIVMSCQYFRPSGTIVLSMAPHRPGKSISVPEVVRMLEEVDPVLCEKEVLYGDHTVVETCTFYAPSEPGQYDIVATYIGSGGAVTGYSVLTVAGTTTAPQPSPAPTSPTPTPSQPATVSSSSNFMKYAVVGIAAVSVVALGAVAYKAVSKR
jgi:hypothetical protein